MSSHDIDVVLKHYYKHTTERDLCPTLKVFHFTSSGSTVMMSIFKSCYRSEWMRAIVTRILCSPLLGIPFTNSGSTIIMALLKSRYQFQWMRAIPCSNGYSITLTSNER